MQKNKIAIIVGVICIIVGFVVGILVGKSSGNQAASQSGARQFVRNSQNGSSVMGQVSAVTGNSLTIALPNGGSEIVFYSTSTPIMKSVEASSSALAAGQDVVVVGTANSDGSVTADSIQLRSASQGAGPQGYRTGQ